MLHYIKWLFISVIIGVMAGAAAALFLYLLDFATSYRDENQVIIWGLPVAGLVIGWIYHRFSKDASQGHNLILDEIHNPRKVLPLRMAPLVLFGTVVTHLFGGSAGREGTAVQMGGSLADQLSHLVPLSRSERKLLLMCGMGAGFGAAIGAPFAGALFGMEVIAVGRLRLTAWIECLISSFVAFATTEVLHAPHTIYPVFPVPPVEIWTLLVVAFCGALFGLAALAFVTLTHGIEQAQKKWVKYPPLRPFLGGFVLVALFYFFDWYQYAGLSLSGIQSAIEFPPKVGAPFIKALLTALTVGSGFKGGEFIPLVYIGTTLGAVLGALMPVSFQLLSGVGFAAVFAGAANTPLACTLMAMEIFGYQIGLYAMVACYMSFLFSGSRSIYPKQMVYREKLEWLHKVLPWKN